MSSWIPEGREAPSAAAIATAAAILAATAGYFVGQASSIGLFGGGGEQMQKKRKKKKQAGESSQGWPNNYNVKIHPDSSDEELMEHLRGGKKGEREEVADSEEEEDDDDDDDDDDEEEEEEESSDEPEVEDATGELKTFVGTREECKLVLCVRTDLGMGKGKIAAQASHATLANYRHLTQHQPNSPLLQRWNRLGQAKIAVQVSSEEQLEELQARAMSLGLCARVVRDAGRTQIAAGSATVLGVGPGPRSVVDEVTGGLKLL